MVIDLSVQYNGGFLPDIILFKEKTFQLVKRFRWEHWL